jgi:hypothetical protein
VVARVGGHGDETCVCVDGGGFCGGLVLGCSEVGLGFMGAHCVDCDRRSCFCFFAGDKRGVGKFLLWWWMCDAGCKIMGPSWF